MYRKILVCFCRNRNYSTSSQNCRCHFVFLNSIYSHIWGNGDFLKLLYFADVKSSVSFFFRVDEWIIKSCIKPLQIYIFYRQKILFSVIWLLRSVFLRADFSKVVTLIPIMSINKAIESCCQQSSVYLISPIFPCRFLFRNKVLKLV